MEAAAAQGNEAYAAAKRAQGCEECRTLFELAAKRWEVALRLCGAAVQDSARLHSNLASAHLNLAMLAAETSQSERLRYHVRELHGNVERRAVLLGDLGTWDKFTTKFLAAEPEAPLTFEMRMAVLRAFLQPSLPATAARRVAMSSAARLVQKAVLVTKDCAYDDLKAAFQVGGAMSAGLPEGLRAWTVAQQHVLEASRYLTDAALLGESSDIEDAAAAAGAEEEAKQEERLSLATLADQASFLLHRSAAMLQLFCASRQLSGVFLHEESVQVGECLEVLDMFIQAVQVSQLHGDAPPILGSRLDVEMTSVSLYHLAKLYAVLGLAEQAARRYAECIRVALSLDHTGRASLDTVIQGSSLPQGAVFAKWWFREATAYLRARQDAAAESDEKAQRARLEKIRAEVEKLKAANTGMEELANHLIKTYPRAQALERLAKPVSKVSFMRVLVAYNPDKQHIQPMGWPHNLEAWKDFCTEAAKALNYYYEKEFKYAENASQQTEDSEGREDS